MRSTHALAAAALTATALLTLATPGHAGAAEGDPTTDPATETTTETGHVVDCTGTWKGRPVFASVYENDQFGNEVNVSVGEDGDEVGATRTTDAPLLVDGEIATGLRLDGRRARIAGTYERVGKKIAVHEEHDDAGYHIVVDGFHKRLDTDLAMTWRRTTVPLSCDTAFLYDLVVQKTPTT